MLVMRLMICSKGVTEASHPLSQAAVTALRGTWNAPLPTLRLLLLLLLAVVMPR